MDNLLMKGEKPTPFSITFYYNDKKVTVKLKNGEDIIRIASLIQIWLITHGIETEIINGDNKLEKNKDTL